MIFYDFEVFSKDWLVVLLDGDNETRIHNDAEALREFVDDHINEVWTGYNSLNYDRRILAAVLAGRDNKNIKKLNDALINGEGSSPWQKVRNAGIKTVGLNLDIVPQFDGIYKINGKPQALKTAEGYAGISIKESTVPFNLKRALTPEELEETFSYCAYDVAQTKAIFDAETHRDYDTKAYFIEKYSLPIKCVSDTIASLAERILEGNGRGGGRESAGRFQLPDTLRLTKYKYIQDLRESPFGREIAEGDHNLKNDIRETIAGVPHVLGSGGIHSEREGIYHHEGKILSLDITACYPSLMERYGIARRVVDRWDRFLEIHRANIEFKRQGDKAARQPYKILDNSISGKLKAPFSTLYDPQSNTEICQSGIFFLVDLLEHIETGAPDVVELIQSNTDGLYYALLQPERLPEVLEIVNEWQGRTGLSMDSEVFDGIFHQRDVNNYLIADKNGKIIKSKGEIKPLKAYDYNLPIINKALKAYLVKGTLPEEIVNNCNDLHEFQLIAHVSKDGKLRTGSEELTLRTVRAFASADTSAGGLEEWKNDKWIKYRNTPEHVFLDNGDVRGKVPPPELNKDWYISRIYERLIDWTGQVLRDEERSTAKGRKVLKESAKKENGTQSSGGSQREGETPPEPEELLKLRFEKKPFSDYTHEEIAAGALRRLKEEYLDPNNLSFAGSKWNVTNSEKWILRLKAHGDDLKSERALILTIHFDGAINAQLVDPRVDLYSTAWKWEIWRDPDYKTKERGEQINASDDFSTITEEEVNRLIQNEIEKKKHKAGANEAEREEKRSEISEASQEYAASRPIKDIPNNSNYFGIQYLRQKGILPYALEVDPALRINSASGLLLVPYTYDKKLYALQKIGTEGFKQWHKGTHPKGRAAHVIKGRSNSVVAICEGLATGLSAHRRYGGRITVFAAGDANSLEKLAVRLLRRYPKLGVVIAADNDVKEGTTANKGLETARKIEEEQRRLLAEGKRDKDAFFYVDIPE